MSFRFGLVDTNPFNICSLPPLTYLVNLIQLTLANLYNAAMSSSALIVYSRKRTERHNCRMSVSIRHFRENISGQEEARSRCSGQLRALLRVRRAAYQVWGFPRDKKGYLYHNSCRRTSYDRELIRLKPRFQTRDFAERCSDKVRVAICAPHAAHSIALRSIKTVIHAPGFYGFALQILLELRFAQVI